MQEVNVGVIGNGFVGNSIYHTFSPMCPVRVYDVVPEKSSSTLEDLIDKSDIVFVCVPTPMKADGHIDLKYVENVFERIAHIANDLYIDSNAVFNKLYVIKSTVIPGTTDHIREKYGVNVIFSPEFLTERTAVLDAICSNHTIVGASDQNMIGKIVKLYMSRFGTAHRVYIVDTKVAEFIKYMRNCYFATKVTYMNEMYNIAQYMGVDWEAAVSGFAMDGRIAHSHLQVPGHDGKFGFGGTCFPKDLNAIIAAAKDAGYEPTLLGTVVEANDKFRGVQEWNDMVGRAVSGE